MGKIRGTHSSPGVYTKFTDLSYAAKTLGITTLGIAGETLKGPAFEPILIEDYNQFRDYFGGTSAEKFKDSQYPKYQLPYIAKSYLSASDRLYVCRVLGLSGYNAGPAFLITATNSAQTETHVIAVLRSRGVYKKFANVGTDCEPNLKYDTLQFDCDKVTIEPYTNVNVVVKCGVPSASGETATEYPINALNYGQFTLVAWKYDPENKKAVNDYVEVGRYPVSLNAGTKDYIYNVLGSKATEGSAAIFVEELYDVLLEELIINQTVDRIGGTAESTSGSTKTLTKVNELVIAAVTDPVRDFVTIPEANLTRKQLGQTFVCGEEGSELTTGDTGNGFMYHPTDDKGIITSDESSAMTLGGIYLVKSYTNTQGVKSYVYVEVKDDKTHELIRVSGITHDITYDEVKAVRVLEYDSFVCLGKDREDKDALVSLSDMSDYHDQFRCASTPWAVSELKGDGKDLQVKKLFRFHTISDGTESNTEVKISIANIRPDDGRFDVYVRDFGDSDGNVTILESYKNLTMVPGDPKYIGLQIGTLDGAYELKSKYVMVEVIENDMTKNCVPCGFLGYPVRDYSAYKEGDVELTSPTFTYNTIYDEDIKAKRQYFGLSDLTGIDSDMLSYKGKNAYTEEYDHGYTKPFHLDSTLSDEVKKGLGTGITITIDGDLTTSGISWSCVSANNVPTGGDAPIMGSESDMETTIYADKALRKFTMCFYGGFDGWDIYRNSRTNTDEFKASKYKGAIKNGWGQTFSKIQDGTNLALEGNCITSDYYAFLAAYNQFEIPEKFIINLFATPGIDYVNNTSLVEDALDMIEEKRQDSLYVVDTPDKPWGASDAVDEMYSSKDAAENLEDVGIDTYYACTYYPWVKYFDGENNIFINLPATKDVLRNMADVDNKKFPWYAPAGIERGKVDCTRMHFFAKLEDEDNVYDGRINPLKTFSQDGVKVWGNKTMYTGDTPMNRVNTVRLMLYMRKLIIESTRVLLFEPNDTTLKAEFEDIVNPILAQIKRDRGITDYRLDVEQTPEMMDAHELQCKLWVKPTPTLEYIEIEFMVTPQGVSFSEL